MQFVSRSLERVKKALFGPRTPAPERQPIPVQPPPRSTEPGPMPHPMSYAEHIRFGLPRVPIGWTIPLMQGIDPAPPYVPHFAHEQAGMER